MRVLIVDNDRLIAEQLKDALQQLGYEVHFAADGLEGLERNRQLRPDVVLLDLLLPKLDGYRFCKYIREDPEFSSLPVIVLSAVPPEELTRAIQAGATATLEKQPMAQMLPKLADAIERVLRKEAVPAEHKLEPGTPRLETLRELLKERSHFLEILQVLPQGIMELDSDHRITSVNYAACKLLSMTESGIIGKKITDLFLSEGQERLRTTLQRLSSGEAQTVQEPFLVENHSIKISLSPLLSSGSFNGAVVSLLDATAEVLRTEELNRQNRQLQQMKQELERRLTAMQTIHRLSSEIEYPYGSSEILEAILRFLHELINLQVASAMIKVGDVTTLHVFLKEDVGEENLNSIKTQMIEKSNPVPESRPDPAKILYHFSGVAASTDATLGPIRSSLFLPLKMEEKPAAIIGCFSRQPNAFSYFDEQLLSIFVNMTFHAVANMKNLVDAERIKMQAMVESMVDGVLMADQNDEIVIMNQAAKKILRVSRREDSITKKYFQETLGFYPFRLTKGLVHKNALQATIKEEIKVFDKTLHSIVAPVYDVEGQHTGTVVVLRDITEQKELEERKNDFLSIISHELRTPLASIGGSLDLVLENVVGQINEKQQRYLELAKNSCQKLNLVIDDLLDISKFEKGKMQMAMDPISIVQLVDEVAEKFQPSAMEKQIILKLEKPAQDVRIYGDYNRLVQVMNNLLSNAIKFTPQQGEIEIRIFTPKVMSPHIGVSVKDTGPGIRAEDLERVFDKFEQVRRSDTRKIGGTGLGLAISRNIIETHKGKIWAESKPGEGAKFIILLPVEKRASIAPEIYEESADSGAAGEIHAILIAADADTAYLLKGILLERGIRVTLSYNAQEGFSLVRQMAPQMMLVDLDLEDSSGSQLIEILSHDPETTAIPIIAFSRGDSLQTSPFSNVLHVQKPIEMNHFLQALSNSLQKIRGGDKRRKILLIDDDPNMRMITREALQYQNYLVVEAVDGAQALEQLKYHRPDLILLDVMLPDIDGFQIAQIIRSNITTSHIPIVFLTAKGQTEDKVKALKAGATDYLVKPVDSTELAARIETIVERTEAELSASPTTKLPGSVAIEKEINQLISQRAKFALCYLDLDNLKSYNDEYGYAKADAVVKQTGDIIRETVLRMGHPTDFVGHIAGDDFVFITQADLADSICIKIIERFDQIIPFFYRQEDRARGYIEARDRFGVWRKFAILSVSVVCVTNEEQELLDHVQIATLAAEFKREAKAIDGSCYVRNGKTITVPKDNV